MKNTSVLVALAALLLTSASGEARAQVPTTQYPYAQPGVSGPPPQHQVPAQQPQYPYGTMAAPPTTYGPAYGGPSAHAPRASDEDSGRKLELFYARAGFGGAFASLDALSGTNLQLQRLSGVGGALEVGLGVRLLLLTVGPRARALVLSNATLWQLGGEIALRLPLGRWDPFVAIQGGYTFGSKPRDDIECRTGPCQGTSTDSVSISGADLGVAGGLDYYVTPSVSLGGDLAAMMLLLSRDRVPLTGETLLDDSASMTGLGLKLGAHAAIHF